MDTKPTPYIPELLAPAGSYDIMEQAFKAGADAVYLGGQHFGARAFAGNLTEEELLRGIDYAHLHGKKLYLTANTLIKDGEIHRLLEFLENPYRQGLDAVILQDVGAAHLIRKYYPELPIHGSTQMTICTTHGIQLAKEYSATRVVPARELSILELEELKKEGLEVEVFVHGALCYSYSGQCLLSSFIGGRSGNRGRCAQPCRQLYVDSVTNKKQYWLSPADLYGLSSLPELMNIQIDSFKIEGRMKKAEYVIGVTKTYRQGIDYILQHGNLPNEENLKSMKLRLMDLFNRGGFTTGYYQQHNGCDMMSMQRNNHQGVLIGKVIKINKGKIMLHLLEDLHPGDVLEIQVGAGRRVELTSGIRGCSHEDVMINGKELRQIKIGNPVYRTKSHHLCQELIEENKQHELKEKIKITVKIKQDEFAMITAVAKGIEVSITGELVTKAENIPLTKDILIEKISKLGNTPFELEELIIDLDPGCFYSMKSLNTLRRQVLDELTSKYLTAHQRILLESLSAKLKEEESSFTQMGDVGKAPSQKKTTELYYGIGVSRINQLKVALSIPEVNRVDLEYDSFTYEELKQGLAWIREAKKEAALAMPRIMRKSMESELSKTIDLCWDYILVRTLDEFAFCKNRAKDSQLILDSSVYAYNQYAKQAYKNIESNVIFTLPTELNLDELQALTTSTDIMEWVIYQQQMVMVSAQCPWKNSNSCNKNRTRDINILSNDYGDEFLVQAKCKHCYCLFMTKEPVVYTKYLDAMLNVSRYRLSFHSESEKQMREIIQRVIKKESISGNEGNILKGID